jgi:glyoxylase-like metal-dependent hydrolase (beta-lactamase superfamily II)
VTISIQDIRALHLGHFTRHPEEPGGGNKYVVRAYLVRHPRGLLLFDTGITTDSAEVDEAYHPVRRSLRDALGSAGVRPDDVSFVVNCHLHVDHAGGNAQFPGTPIFAQAREYDSAHEPDYTVPSVADFEGATFELLQDEEAEILPGITVVPTPGHTPGHQSLVVGTDRGVLVFCGQGTNEASDYSRARFAWEVRDMDPSESSLYPDWLGRLQDFEPQRVLFAHDTAVWDADPLAIGGQPPRA